MTAGSRGQEEGASESWRKAGAQAILAVEPPAVVADRGPAPPRGSTPYPGPAGRICPEPTSKGPRKLEQAPKEAAQPLTQLGGWGKPHNYGGGLPPTMPPSKCRSPHLSASSPDLKPPYLGGRAQQNFCSGKFTPKTSPEKLNVECHFAATIGECILLNKMRP